MYTLSIIPTIQFIAVFGKTIRSIGGIRKTSTTGRRWITVDPKCVRTTWPTSAR